MITEQDCNVALSNIGNISHYMTYLSVPKPVKDAVNPSLIALENFVRKVAKQLQQPDTFVTNPEGK